LELTNEFSPGRIDNQLAETSEFRALLARGGLCSGLPTTLIATQFPGPMTQITAMSLGFNGSPEIGDHVTVNITVVDTEPVTCNVSLECSVTRMLPNKNDEDLCRGHIEVTAPAEHLYRPVGRPVDLRAEVPPDRFNHLENLAREGKYLTTGIVFPVSATSLVGALQSADANLIRPVLIGPEKSIREVAEAEGLDLSGIRIVAAETEEDAAGTAADMAADGKLQGLMKGSLHTATLLRAFIAHHDLRTDRRISHVFVIDVPDHPRLLLISDGAINISPTIEELRDIVRNTIDLAHVLGVKVPKVALLSAVENVVERIPSTEVAAALSKMADRGAFPGAEVDGPLAFDDAVSAQAAEIKGIKSPVAGAPDVVSGNILAKSFEHFGHAKVAGVVVGARIPLALTSRAGSPRERRASAALMCLAAAHGWHDDT
jgi:phosphotransacetylase